MILVAGVLIRLLLLLWLADKPIVSDGAHYNEMSGQLIRGESFVPFWPPGVPLYLALVHKLFGPGILATRLAMLVFYVCTSLFVYRAATLMTASSAAGNIAMGFLAISPASIHGSLEPLTQLPAAMCLTIIAYCLIRLESAQAKRGYASTIALLAVTASYLALTRASSLLLVAALPLYLLWRTRKWIPALTVAAVAAVVVGCWIGYVYGKTGQFVKINTSNASNFYLGNNPYTPVYRTWWLGSHDTPPEVPAIFIQERDRIMSLDAASQEAEFSRIANEHIRRRPDLFVLRSLNRVCTYFAFDPFSGAYLMGNYGLARLPGFAIIVADVLVFFLISVGSILYFTVPRSKEGSLAPFLILGVGLLYALPYFFVYSHPHYRHPLEPLLMILSSGFFVYLLNGKGAALRNVMEHRTLTTTVALVAFALIQVEFFFIVMLHRV
jgi:4-amino-4-deoxy-L-arabinose transferase-like glycosyltransferase